MPRPLNGAPVAGREAAPGCGWSATPGLDVQQERIDLAARELAEVSERRHAAARALRQSISSLLAKCQAVLDLAFHEQGGARRGRRPVQGRERTFGPALRPPESDRRESRGASA